MTSGARTDRRRPSSSRVGELMALSPAESSAWGGLLVTHKEIIKLVAAEVERSYGLPLTSYDVLRHLGLAGDQRVRMSDLADRVMITRSGLTGVVSRLESESLVRRRRDESDSRGWYVELTEAGWQLVRLVNGTVTESVRRLFLDALSTQDMQVLSDIWAKLADHLRNQI